MPATNRKLNYVTLDLNLHTKQGEAFNTPATELLYGGAAGGGKSHLMRVAAVVWAAAIPGLQVYLFRRMHDDLIKNHMEGPKGFRAMLAPWVQAGFATIVQDEIRFWNGSKIYLCHCHDEKDRFKYLGAEIHVLLIDELTTFTEVIYRFLRGRVRAVGLDKMPGEYKGRFPRILCSSNPGSIGHHWVKAAFIDNARPFELRRMDDDEGGMLRQYIPARLDDNPSMQQDDPSYRSKLRGLGSAALVKAMEEGDWNVVAGAFFDCWATDRHVIDPFAIPNHWTRFTSFDWGSARPFSVGWWAVSDGSNIGQRQYPAGALIRYREWYGASGADVGLTLTAEQVADGIRQRERVERYGEYEPINYRVADPSCWKVDGGPSIAERMAKRGVNMRPADNGRVNGWDQVRSRLLGDDIGLDGGFIPMLYVFSTCTAFIRTVPALQHDEDKPEDIDTDSEDHVGDETRYACQSRPYTRKPNVVLPMRGASEMRMSEAWELANNRLKHNARI